MEFVTDRETAPVLGAHRVTWFVPDRPVDGGTVFKRPVAEPPRNLEVALLEDDRDI